MRACGMRNSVVWNFLPPVVRRGQAPNVPLPLVSGAASSTRWRSESGWLSNNLQAYNWTEAISWGCKKLGASDGRTQLYDIRQCHWRMRHLVGGPRNHRRATADGQRG